jgi:hypothetical protein
MNLERYAQPKPFIGANEFTKSARVPLEHLPVVNHSSDPVLPDDRPYRGSAQAYQEFNEAWLVHHCLNGKPNARRRRHLYTYDDYEVCIDWSNPLKALRSGNKRLIKNAYANLGFA